jgi:hypothetical protein
MVASVGDQAQVAVAVEHADTKMVVGLEAFENHNLKQEMGHRSRGHTHVDVDGTVHDRRGRTASGAVNGAVKTAAAGVDDGSGDGKEDESADDISETVDAGAVAVEVGAVAVEVGAVAVEVADEDGAAAEDGRSEASALPRTRGGTAVAVEATAVAAAFAAHAAASDDASTASAGTDSSRKNTGGTDSRKNTNNGGDSRKNSTASEETHLHNNSFVVSANDFEELLPMWMAEEVQRKFADPDDVWVGVHVLSCKCKAFIGVIDNSVEMDHINVRTSHEVILSTHELDCDDA